MKMPCHTVSITAAASCTKEMPTCAVIDLESLPNKLDFCCRVARRLGQALLDALHLLRHCRQDALFESVEFVETAPSADLA